MEFFETMKSIRLDIIDNSLGNLDHELVVKRKYVGFEFEEKRNAHNIFFHATSTTRVLVDVRFV